MAQHNDLGKKGEALAVDHLEKNGYIILERNYRFDKAEVDIIATKDDDLVIIEVKTRSNTHFGAPEDFVKTKQIKNLVKAVDAFINANALDLDVRFDIIALVKEGDNYTIKHLKDAFYHF